MGTAQLVLASPQLAVLALEAAQLGAWEVNIPGPTIWDARTRALHGADPSTPIDAEAARNFVHPNDREALDRVVAESLAAGGRGYYEAEYRVNNPEIKPRWVKVTAHVVTRDGVMIGFRGVVQDVTIHKQHEHVRTLLRGEFAHRTKNLIGVISSMARRTFTHPAVPPEILSNFQNRLFALARSHQLLVFHEEGVNARLQTVIAAAIEPFCEASGSSIITGGPDLSLDSETSVALSLILHELLTNATKYGALSVDAGIVELHWDVEQCGDGSMLKLNWAETGGPEVTVPETCGFGTTLITGILGHDKHTRNVALHFRPTGVTCEMKIVLCARR